MADDVVSPAHSVFEALAESAPDAIITIDADSTILAANPAVRRIFGYEPEELIGRSLTSLMPEPLRERHRCGFQRYLQSGVKRIPWTGTRLTALRKNGTEIPIEISFGEFVDDAGRRLFSGFVRDISEHLRQQRAFDSVREDLHLQTQLLAAVEQAIISTQPDGTILTWNRFAERLYGWGADEAIGRNLQEILDPLGEFDDGSKVLRQLRAGERVSYQRRVRRKSGEAIWVAVVAAPMYDGTGSVARMVGTSVDVTERHQLEAQLRQAQKLDAIGRLAGGVAHDFNNLLTVILANSELAAASVPAGSELASDIAEISKAASRGAALTRQLLTFSRREPITLRRLDLNEVVGDLEKMLRRLIPASIRVELRLGSDVPQIEGDVGHIEQAITNLVVNARDAMPAGGTVTISTTHLVLEERRMTPAGPAAPGHYAAISVSDTGHGMSDQIRARIFEPFFTTKSAGKGTGLGLATVYGIVTQAGGFAEVESEIGEGATFRLCFPAVG